MTYTGTAPSALVTYSYDSHGNLLQKVTDYSYTVTGTTMLDEDAVTDVSDADMARLLVGATVTSANLPADTTIASLGTNAFAVSASALASGTGVMGVTGTETEQRNSFVTGTVALGSSTVSNVSASDLALLTSGDPIIHFAFPSGTTVSSIGSDSFVVSNDATASATATAITVVTSSWPSTDVVNGLNQIMRNDITALDGTTTTWRYSYDASGNMTAQFNGTVEEPTNVTSYTWDEENRLTLVTLPDSTTIAYSYDVRGRMLTRKVSTDENPSTFEWDGMNMVREVDASGNVTQYFVVRGVIRSFLRGGITYQVHSSAQGHVRLITDEDGDVVFSASYDAWGNTLSVTDSVPDGGWMYRYVGAYGCRLDTETGLTYMRARWYSAGLHRLITRDPIRAANLYIYVDNSPSTSVDPLGTQMSGNASPFGSGPDMTQMGNYLGQPQPAPSPTPTPGTASPSPAPTPTPTPIPIPTPTPTPSPSPSPPSIEALEGPYPSPSPTEAPPLSASPWEPNPMAPLPQPAYSAEYIQYLRSETIQAGQIVGGVILYANPEFATILFLESDGVPLIGSYISSWLVSSQRPPRCPGTSPMKIVKSVLTGSQ